MLSRDPGMCLDPHHGPVIELWTLESITQGQARSQPRSAVQVVWASQGLGFLTWKVETVRMPISGR